MSTNKKISICVSLIFITIGIIIIGFIYLLIPINDTSISLTIDKGESFSDVLTKLEEKKVIRNAKITKLYCKIFNYQPIVKAGLYQIPANTKTIKEIFSKLEIKDLSKNITFYPGSTLNFRNNSNDPILSHREVLLQAGYGDAEITTAFNKLFGHAIFGLLPELTSLEGLIYADTFKINSDLALEQVMEMNFDYYLKMINQNKLEEKYKSQGLTLYQGIILASIIEKEVPKSADRRTVAQIFFKRLRKNSLLGSDVTYQYANRLAGTDNDLYVKSPYNTRQVVGLTPTPIGSPSLDSLMAVSEPTNTDYEFFVSGDDNNNYFSKTYEEHNKNIYLHCKIKCAQH